MSHVMNTYARQPVAFVRGEGVWLWDEAGKKYLDALAGIAVNTLGYAHPRLTRALSERITQAPRSRFSTTVSWGKMFAPCGT